MKKWIHWEFVFGKTLKKDTKISLGEIQSAFQGDQPPIGRSRKLGFQREFYVPVFQRNGDSTCLRPKRNWDSTGKFPKGTEIPLPCVQKELRFHLPTSKKNFYSTCPPPKSTETPTTHVPKSKKSSLQLAELSRTLVQCQNPPKTFWVATRVLLFCCPRKKKVFFFLRKIKLLLLILTHIS
jgi:hypothetical protein